MQSHAIRSKSFRAKPRNRRGVALLLAIFSMVVVGTTTVAYVASRESGMAVSRNAQMAADSRALAAAGLELTTRILRDSQSNWRTSHIDGRLLSRYALDDGIVSVDLVDIERRDAGYGSIAPTSTTTEVEATVTSQRGGSTWTTVAQMSLPAESEAQYAIFADQYLGLIGSQNSIGRWMNAPDSDLKLRIYLGTNALLGTATTGVYVKSGTLFDSTVSGKKTADSRTNLSTWVTYPSIASLGTIWGDNTSAIAQEALAVGKGAALMSAPAAPTVSGTFTNYTTTQVRDGVTATYTPFRVKAAFLPQTNLRDLEFKGKSVITLTAGTYEVWGTWKLNDSRVIIQGDVKIVVNPNMRAKGLEWKDSSIELDPNATLEIFNGYTADIDHCWVGARYTCSAETNAAIKDSDGHKRLWMVDSNDDDANDPYTGSVCQPTRPASPAYIEPSRISFLPLQASLASVYSWVIKDSSIVGSIYLPTNTLELKGNTIIWGRIAAKFVKFDDTSGFRYDHSMDAKVGLTTGARPARGGDPEQVFPVRVVRYGFDAEAMR